MSTRGKSHPLNGVHTAGIYTDTVNDGPEIGTLVLVVDRAKNLPNRKTIGKQDPYCAARLGKEAKKTTTDIRGGQTPKWDQELRFVVYDSPDYYQLKVSTFNDDKKTDLIGETWIDLRDIVVGGGGQSDQWHQLNFKGKYAGEIRIEITFYDSRPKPEKPAAAAAAAAVKPKQPADADAAYGSLPRVGGPKRRPLPSDPVTGQPPASSVPDHVHQTPPRPQANPPTSYIATQSPLQAVEYNTPPPVPPRQQQQQQHREPEHPPSAPPAAAGYSTPHRKEPSHLHHARSLDIRDNNYSAEPEFSSPDYAPHDYDHHDHHSSRNHHEDGLIPYHNANNNAPTRFDDSDPIPVDDDRPPPPPVHRSRNNSGGGGHDVMFHNSFDTSPQKATPPTMRHDVLRNEAHRRSVPSTYPGQPTYKPYNPSVGSTITTMTTTNHYTAPEPEQPSPPRHHSYDSSFDSHPRHTHAAALDDGPESPTHYGQNSFRTSGSRIPSYDHDYNEPEFAKVPSPAPLNLTNRGKSSSNSSSYHQDSMSLSHHRRQESSGYPTSPSPLTTRDYRSTSPTPMAYDSSYDPHNHWSELDDTHVERPNSSSYALPPVPSSLVPGVDPGLALELSSRIREESRHHQRRHTTQNMATPPRGRQMMIEAPPSTYGQGSSPPGFNTPPHISERSPISFSGGPSPAVAKPRAISPRPSHSRSHRHSQSPSPNPNHTIRRKSISPAPPPPPSTEGRRLSGIPFGPDSFDALNPTVAAATKEAAKKDLSATNGKIIMYDGREVDPSDHLPQETWAPEPEPKAGAGALSTSPSHHSSNSSSSHHHHSHHHHHHHSLSGGHHHPAGSSTSSSSGRRQLRVAGVPQQPASTTSSAQYISGTDAPSPPSAANRNKLQKKANRASAMPVLSGSTGSSPLAPLPHPRHQDNFTPPRALPRANTFDYPNENHAPLYGSGSPSRGTSSAPPIPAKIPLGGGGGGSPASGRSHSGNTMMSGAIASSSSSALVPTTGPGAGWGGGSGSGSSSMSNAMVPVSGGSRELALIEDIRSIDLGPGRARRHQLTRY